MQYTMHDWICARGALRPAFLATLGLAAALATAGPGAAQTAPAAEPGPDSTVITFDRAVDMALRQSTTIHRARNAEDLAQLSVQDARMQFAPDLRLSGGWNQDFGRTFNTNEGQLLSGNTGSGSARVSSSITLFDGFRNINILKAANLDEAAAELDTQRAEQTVVFSVISGYLDLIAAKEQVRVADENLLAQEQLLKQVRTLADAGTRPIVDLYQQQAQVAAAKSALVDARRNTELRKVALIQVLQLDPVGSYTFAAPAMPDSVDVGTELDVNALLRAAYASRPDLDAAQRAVGSAEAGVSAARATWWPSVSLSAGYGSSYTNATNLGLADQLRDKKSGSLGLSLSFPLFDRLGTQRATERARIQADNASLALTDLRQQIALEVRRAVLDRKAAVEQMNAAEARVKAAGQALAAVQERYNAGLATIFEVTQSRAELVSASSASVNARYSLLFQQKLLDYYVGNLDPAAGLPS